MTDQEINAAIRLHLGLPPSWWRCENHSEVDGPNCPWCSGPVTHEDYTDFCGDLNAMHEAEGALTAVSIVAYLEHLGYPMRLFPAVHATARQRAEAFLRTIGKWKEDA